MKKIWLSAAALFALPGLTGCGGSSSSGSNAPALVPRSVSTTLSNGLTGTLTEDRSTVAVGGTVTYTATLTNNTTQPITFGYSLGPNDINPGAAASVPAVLVVSNPSGQYVSPPEGTAQIGISFPSFTLAPGQSISGSEADSTLTGFGYPVGFVSAGKYSASAAFEVTPPPSANTSQPIHATTGPLTVTAQ